MEDQLPLYPTGQIGMGTGNLKTATIGRWTITNGASLRHSLALSPSGITFGNVEVAGTIEFEVPAKGLERNVINDVASGTRRSFRFKDAVDVHEIVGALTQADWEAARGDAIKVSANFIGKLIKKK